MADSVASTLVSELFKSMNNYSTKIGIIVVVEEQSITVVEVDIGPGTGGTDPVTHHHQYYSGLGCDPCAHTLSTAGVKHSNTHALN